jgi:hypothetical protein
MLLRLTRLRGSQSVKKGQRNEPFNYRTQSNTTHHNKAIFLCVEKRMKLAQGS